MVYIVEKSLDVGFQNIVDLLCHDRMIDVFHHIMRTSLFTESV